MSTLKSVLIIRGGAIGDFILTLPSLHVLREHHPSARIEIMGYPHISVLARERFYADATRSVNDRAVAMFFARKGTLDPALSAYFASFDLLVNFVYDPDDLFTANLAKAGVKRVISADGRPASKSHATEHLAQWLGEIGLPREVAPPRVYVSEADTADALQKLPALQKPVIGLHLGSGSPTKNWPMARFLDVARHFQSRGIGVLVIEGPADRHATDAGFWSDPGSKGCVMCRDLPLIVLAAALRKCAVFVGHDSGITHLAAAVGTAVVAIFGPTDPRLWSPRGKRVTVLRRGPEPSAVKVEEVIRAAEAHLGS